MFKWPNIPPKISTLSAIIVGYLLIDESNDVEQNALGNWLMLVAQTLCTNAYFLQLQDQRNSHNNEQTPEDVMNMLKKMVNALNIEINNLKKEVENMKKD